MLVFLISLSMATNWPASTADNGQVQLDFKDNKVKEIDAIRYNKPNNCIVAADRSRRLFFFALPSYELVHVVKAHDGSITDMHFVEDTNELATASKDGAVKFWDSTSGKLLTDWKPATDDIAVYRVAATKEHAARGYQNGYVSYSKDKFVNTFEAKSGPVELYGSITGLHFANSSKSLFVARSTIISEYDAVTGNIIESLVQDQILENKLLQKAGIKIIMPLLGQINRTAMTYKGDKLASVGQDIVRLWDVKAKKQVGLIPYSEGVYIAISPNGELVASLHGYYAKNPPVISKWSNGEKHDKVKLLPGAYSFDFSPDSKKLAVGYDGKVIIYDLLE